MAVKSNKEIQKQKREPYQLLLRVTIILVAVVVVGVGIFWACSKMVERDFVTKLNALDVKNQEDEQAFNAEMNALLASQQAASQPSGEKQEDRTAQSWEKELDGALWRVESTGYDSPENTRFETWERTRLINGGLLLVNQWHPLPLDFSEENLVGVGAMSNYKIQVQNSSVRVLAEAYEALATMITDAEALGLKDYIVREGFRSNERQTELFNAEREKLSSKFSDEALDAEAKKSVNYPGTSEYQTGLSFQVRLYNKEDSTITNTKFQTSEQGKWFTENAWKYGVIFRFPSKDFPGAEWEDKSYKTGVSMQLDIYRYVGKPHATVMRVLGFCLEEYIEFLMENPHLYIYQGNTLLFEVYRMEVGEDASYSFPVPNQSSDYNASLDNMGGLVMSCFYNQ